MSKDLIAWAIGCAIALGVIVGLLIVFLIFLQRRKVSLKRLTSLEDLVGQFGVVEVPFDQDCSGKVRIQLENRTLACAAYSHEPHSFLAGDEIVVVGRNGERVWVIPVQDFHA